MVIVSDAMIATVLQKIESILTLKDVFVLRKLEAKISISRDGNIRLGEISHPVPSLNRPLGEALTEVDFKPQPIEPIQNHLPAIICL